MPYDHELATQIRAQLADQLNLSEREMFGGIGFMLSGNMLCGVLQDSLIVRVGAECYQESLAKPHTRLFHTRGRPLKGWVMVDPPGLKSEQDLKKWLSIALDYTSKLPAKKK